MEEKLNISLYIAERKYTLSVLPSEEADVRNAVENINKKVSELIEKYSFKDRQDILAMVALMNTSKLLEYENSINYIENSFGNKLKEIDILVESNLQ